MEKFLEQTQMKEMEDLSKLEMEKIDSISGEERIILQKKIRSLMDGKDTLISGFQGELAPSIEMIDINLNEMDEEVKSIIKVLPKVVAEKAPVKESKRVTFRFPDFSLPNQPKLIRYNYQASDIEKAVNASLQRNIMITIALFGLSMLIILFISHRFLRPIGVLQSSFKKVVDGNLNVVVPAKSRDEIGDLTISFNHMVDELRKNAEKEKLLLRKERLASMGQLAAGVAHEIKNPLNAINLTIEHLGDKLASRDKTVRKYIQTIQNEIGRLDGIVDNFLNFIRSENLNKTDTDVNLLIAEVLHLLESEIISSKITVTFEEAKSFHISLDAERFKTVFLNIILNAIHAMPKGGGLQIQTYLNKKLIKISDTGSGIPAENLDKIFDLFYTTKSKGTGLGLPTAFKIVKEHGGDIEIESEIGKGTDVFIKL
jgi:signal transduction histidine kinase